MDIIIDDSIDDLRLYLAPRLDAVEDDRAINALMDENITPLTRFFSLPKEEVVTRLYRFVRSYIALCPDYLQAYQSLSQMGGIEQYNQPFLACAVQFFFTPHPVIDSTEGVHQLFCQAYLFHRMLEELNDRIELERHLALSPSDLVQTNLVAHTLIGDEQANRLDQSVLIHLELINTERSAATQQLFQQTEVAKKTQQLRDKGWKNIYTRWPFLKEDMTEHFYRH